MRLDWNRLTENVRRGMLTLTKMIPATNRMAVSSALDYDATMNKPGEKPDGAKIGAEAGEMERKAGAVGTIKRHEKYHNGGPLGSPRHQHTLHENAKFVSIVRTDTSTVGARCEGFFRR
jgi:hypothetical protein